MGLKVLHLIDSGGLYGAEKVLLTLVKEQLRQGLEPMILSACLPNEGRKALDKEAEAIGLPIIQWPMKAGLNLIEGVKIARWTETEKFNIIHSHGYKFDILLAFLPPKLRRIPMVATSHGYTHKKLLTKMGVYSIVDRLALFFVESAVTVAQPDAILKLGPFKRKRWVVENGIACDSSRARPKNIRDNSVKKPFNICAIGRMSTEKGFDLLIDAIIALRLKRYDVTLSIAGDGPLLKSLKNQASLLISEGIIDFPGYIDNVSALFDKSHLFVISSFTEGLPVTLLEAMSHNVPVLATNVGAISKLVKHESTGRLILPGSVNELTHGITDFIEQPVEITVAMTDRASELIQKDYSASAMSEKYRLIYTQLAPQK